MSSFEEHYTVKELAKQWKVSRQSVERHLRKYAHLIPNFQTRRRSRFGPIKRPYTSWRIPRSVAERMYRDMMGD